MELIQVALYLIGGVMILTFGANIFVASASHIARRFGISPLVIGLTVVAFGTSAPEFAVNVLAAYQGNADIALGNVVGSNIFNVLGILGVCSLIVPLAISQQLIKLDIPIMVAASALVWLFGYDQKLVLWESLVFLGIMIGYVILQIKLARSESVKIKEEYNKEFSSIGDKIKDLTKLAVGLVLLVIGAKLFVDGAVIGARLLGWSEAVIALTIISIGTSLPEVATSVVATIKGEKEIAVGNVVGSNIFNIFGVLGFSGLFVPSGLMVNAHMVTVDIPFMLVTAGLCLPMALWKQRYDRWLGGVFIFSYASYVWYLISNQ
ncbi:MAG: calcium/sodium antiporter [Bacteriovoracaceae bacterium]